MKNIVVLAFIGLMMMAGIYSTAQSTGGGVIGSIDIKPKWSNTPLIDAKNYTSSSHSGSGKWYTISISYVTAKSMQGLKKTNWLDDVTMTVEMLFPGEYNRQRAIARMTGKVEFWAIPLDGKTHKALMLVPPQIIKRYAREGDKYNRTSIYVKVAFFNRENRILAEGYYSSVANMPKTKIMSAFSSFSGSGKISVGGVLNLGEVILSRDKTPWSAIDWDQYELIKPKISKN